MAAAVQPRVKALHELLSHHMVDIYVGNDNTHWILHEKLLCAKSSFFNNIFYNKTPTGAKQSHTSSNKAFGLPDEDDEPFRLFVGWLYSGRVPEPNEEKDLGDLLNLYLMAEKWQIAELVKAVLDAVRKWYRVSDTFPGLRRVQYIYANTDSDSAMRLLLVGAVARMLVLGEEFPEHWERALSKNGQLSLDLLRAVQRWKLNPDSLPDTRQEAQQAEEDKVAEVAEAEQQQAEQSEQQGQQQQNGASLEESGMDSETTQVDDLAEDGGEEGHDDE